MKLCVQLMCWLIVACNIYAAFNVQSVVWQVLNCAAASFVLAKAVHYLLYPNWYSFDF